MSHLHRVYSPDNEPFDVPAHKRDELVLEKGWSQTPQEPAPPPEEPAVTSTRPRGRERPLPAVETPLEGEADDDDEEEEDEGVDD